MCMRPMSKVVWAKQNVNPWGSKRRLIAVSQEDKDQTQYIYQVEDKRYYVFSGEFITEGKTPQNLTVVEHNFCQNPDVQNWAR